jgi:hypothetical protein
MINEQRSPGRATALTRRDLKKSQNIEEFLTAKAKSNLRFASKKERRIGA